MGPKGQPQAAAMQPLAWWLPRPGWAAGVPHIPGPADDALEVALLLATGASGDHREGCRCLVCIQGVHEGVVALLEVQHTPARGFGHDIFSLQARQDSTTYPRQGAASVSP